MAILLDNFDTPIPGSDSTLAVKVYTSAQVRQRQLMLRRQDGRLQLDAPMLFWADCRLVAGGNKKEIVAVGWSQTMTMTIVEFCYATATHGCIAELDLTPSPCADGGAGIWYGGPNTAALQFLGSSYTRHDNDAVYFKLINQDVLMSGGEEFQQQTTSKRAILSDSPFIAIPEQATCRVTNPNLLNAQTGFGFSIGADSPVRTANNSALLANSQLECVKARYRFTTFLCALAVEDASTVADAVRAYAFAEIKWGADYCANMTNTAISKNWQATGPIKIRDTGAKVTQYARKQGQQINRCPGPSCNLGSRGVVFDYRQLAHFY